MCISCDPCINKFAFVICCTYFLSAVYYSQTVLNEKLIATCVLLKKNLVMGWLLFPRVCVLFAKISVTGNKGWQA